MFVRQNKNRSGSVSVQIITKIRRKYQLVRTVGTSSDPDTIARLVAQAERDIMLPEGQRQLFAVAGNDTHAIRTFIEGLGNANVHMLGPDLIFGTLLERMGFSKALPNDLFRHLVIARLAYPGSKLKTTDYLKRYRGIDVSVDTIYRFLDTLQSTYKEKVEQVAYDYTKAKLGGSITVVFYDMTTLYFEAEDEDDLRKIGWSKDGKFQCPQIMLGLLIAPGGYPIGYDIFEGNTFEGKTLLPVLAKIRKKYGIGNPTVVADAGLLSNANITELTKEGYPFILGGRIKNESAKMTERILADVELLKNGTPRTYPHEDGSSLIVAYTEKRAKKNAYNRDRGLKRLEANIARGKLTKDSLNQRGYNKFLTLEGEVTVALNKEKVAEDALWDGLKGYVTTSNIPAADIIATYGHLWRIERAFRISKTDLVIRPIFHRLRKRIEAHLCIAFVAYAIANELEHLMKRAGRPMTAKRASELTHTMYALVAILPGELSPTTTILQMDPEQQELYKVIHSKGDL